MRLSRHHILPALLNHGRQGLLQQGQHRLPRLRGRTGRQKRRQLTRPLLPLRGHLPPDRLDGRLLAIRLLLRDHQVQDGRVPAAAGLHAGERGQPGRRRLLGGRPSHQEVGQRRGRRIFSVPTS